MRNCFNYLPASRTNELDTGLLHGLGDGTIHPIQVVERDSVTPPLGELSIAETKSETTDDNAESSSNIECARQGVIVLC